MKSFFIVIIYLYSCQIYRAETNIVDNPDYKYKKIELAKLKFLKTVHDIVFRISLDGSNLFIYDKTYLYKIKLLPSLKLDRKVSVVSILDSIKFSGMALSKSSIGLLLEYNTEKNTKIIFKEFDFNLNEIGNIDISKELSSFEYGDINSIKYYYKRNDTLIIERSNRINAIVIYKGVNQYEIVNVHKGSYKTIDVVTNTVYEIKPFITKEKKIAYSLYKGSQEVLNTIADSTEYDNLPSPLLIYNNIIYYGGSGYIYDIVRNKWINRTNSILKKGFADHDRFNFGTYKLNNQTFEISFETKEYKEDGTLKK